MIVEAHTVGQDNWTTLPDENGHTTSDLSDDQACTGGWSNPADAANVLHPFLQHYQTFDPATGTCTNDRYRRASGTRRTAAPAAGSSSRSTSPAAWARQVEISITCAQRLGLPAVPGRVHRRHRRRRTGEGDTSFEDDADPMDGWTVPGAPQDDAGIEGPNRNDWVRRGGLGIKEGAAVATADTLYLGFGLEGITGVAEPQRRDGSRDRLPARFERRRAAPLGSPRASAPTPSRAGPRPPRRRRAARAARCPRVPTRRAARSEVSTASTPRSASDCRKARPVARSPKSPTMSQSS